MPVGDFEDFEGLRTASITPKSAILAKLNELHEPLTRKFAQQIHSEYLAEVWSDQSAATRYPESKWSDLLEINSPLSESSQREIWNSAKPPAQDTIDIIQGRFEDIMHRSDTALLRLSKSFLEIAQRIDDRQRAGGPNRFRSVFEDWDSDTGHRVMDSFVDPMDKAMLNHRDMALRLAAAAEIDAAIIRKAREHLDRIADSSLAALTTSISTGKQFHYGFMTLGMVASVFSAGVAGALVATEFAAASAAASILSQITVAREKEIAISSDELGTLIGEIHAALDQTESVIEREQAFYARELSNYFGEFSISDIDILPDPTA